MQELGKYCVQIDFEIFIILANLNVYTMREWKIFALGYPHDLLCPKSSIVHFSFVRVPALPTPHAIPISLHTYLHTTLMVTVCLCLGGKDKRKEARKKV